MTIAFVMMLTACGLALGQIRSGYAELCSYKSIERLDREFAGRRMSGRSDSIERSLRRILAACPDVSATTDIEARLRILREEWADRSLFIAKYYLNKYWETGYGLSAARSRFNTIIERLPTYSRIDEVRMWLDHISHLPPPSQLQ
jgi:outer membrane protein assembly factor BamD (BamD/ComL family)